jgi:hypothetical protein
VWFYNNISNFHYSYILYTPLQGFHEIGAITKLVVIQKEPSGVLNIDTEFSLRVVTLVAGIKAHIRPKLLPPVAIPIKPDLKLSKENTIMDAYESIGDTENNLNWNAEIEV